MNPLGRDQRNQNLMRMGREMFDLLVIGGGITGAGVARDASSRGMRVAQVEANDFASGTSSRSSKLIHGGIRYLENMEFKLVFEALSERKTLFEIAPHLVHPMRFMIPIFKESRVTFFKMGLGMWLYDLLSLFQAPEIHKKLAAEQTLSTQKELKSNSLVGSYIYYDAYMDDDRLTIETIRSAAHFGAAVGNYIRVLSIEKMPDHYQVDVVDEVTQTQISIRTRQIVSCTGPWTDIFGSGIEKGWKKKLRPTKGIHIILPRNKLPLHQAIVMGAEKSNRIIFGIPRGDYLIVGTTDTDFPENPSGVHSDKADIDYLLQVLKSYFPESSIAASDIISSYSGVRPLVKDDSDTPNTTSREHLIFKDQMGIVHVTGGKYTTYRKMAEDAVLEVIKDLPYEKRYEYKNSRTHEPINDLVNESNYRDFISQDRNIEETKLAERYGPEALKIIKPLKTYSLLQREVAFHIDNTMCLTIPDFFLRRSGLFLYHRDHGLSKFQEISKVFRDKLNYSEKQVGEDLNTIHEAIKKEMGWKNASTTSS
ncbi:MAG: glycerol-3-phosphate dehydrogenase/oxidase [Bdellovibrionaceae bacterium]|nr:glycerol-3-phosphate dehydrogenase/oxidase [Pseudobdellovibrionaceae bacterium]